MKYAKIEDNIIVQIQPNEEVGFIEVADSTVCGMIQDVNGAFTNPEPVIVIPISVTMRQARIALSRSGLLQTVTDAIASSADEELKIEWEFAADVRRDWISLITLTQSLGMTTKQLDDLFLIASKI